MLSLELTLANHSDELAEITVLAHCPLLIVLETAHTDDGRVVFDERGKPCTRAGELVALSAGERRTWTRYIPLAELREARVPSGRYIVKGILTVAPVPYSVLLGEITL